MGVFISSVLVGITGLFDLFPSLGKARNMIGFAVGAGAIFLLASPRLGANVGGTMAAVVSLGWLWWQLRGETFDLARRTPHPCFLNSDPLGCLLDRFSRKRESLPFGTDGVVNL